MINNILIRCLQELEKPEVNIAYVRGMIETLIEMNSPTIEQAVKAMQAKEKPRDEGTALDDVAGAKLPSVRAMAEQSLHD